MKRIMTAPEYSYDGRDAWSVYTCPFCGGKIKRHPQVSPVGMVCECGAIVRLFLQAEKLNFKEEKK